MIKSFHLRESPSLMNPQQRYDQDLQSNLITADAAQMQVVSCLQALFDELLADEQRSKLSVPGLRRLKRRWAGPKKSANAIKGLYLWGGVGRGKTYLMDLFYDCLPLERKLRTHFHRFMQRVHGDLARLQGEKNPLALIADKIASEAKVLCFDEFFVQDIADAMILAGLLEALMQRDVVLLATSNISADRLYENGLQRDRFLPAIELIKMNAQIIEIEKGVDYRLRNLSQATLYHYPIVEETEQQLLACFLDLAPDKQEVEEAVFIELLSRKLQTRYCADDVVWFEFEHLCDGPRSAFDYVELAKMYHAVLLSAVPQLDEDCNDSARRFINLVDELYDRRVKLIVAADAPIQTLYKGQKLAFEFERTCSRLIEMQSQQYLGYQHRA